MFYLVIFSILLIILGVYLFLSKPKNKRDPITGRSILSEREKIMFFLLQNHLPDHIILTQVSFNALMTTQGFHTRSLFNRKMADFVVVNQEFKVICVIELDDASHNGREHIDAERDAMMKEAGYPTLRYRQIPDPKQLRYDFKTLKK